MRSILFVACTFLLLVTVASCNNAQSDAVKQAELIQKTVKENSPGTIPTSATGHYMTATIDGKKWSASYMMPYTDVNGSYLYIVGENDGDDINFQLWKQGIGVGKKFEFSEDHAANLNLKDVSAFFGGYSGLAEITRLDDKWLEGTFHFNASSHSSDKKVTVTDGRFRIAIVPGHR
jgi:hypothetical protein